MTTAHIGQPVNRVDGRAKVTGQAKYAGEHPAPDLTYGAGAWNPVVFVLVLLVLTTVVAIASLVPAARAARVDAMVALRQD